MDTFGQENIPEQPISPESSSSMEEQEEGLGSAREKLARRVQEALDRHAQGEGLDKALTTEDLANLRTMDFNTLQHLISEVVADSLAIAAKESSSEVIDSAAEPATEVNSEQSEAHKNLVESLLKEVEDHKRNLENLIAIEELAPAIIKYYEDLKKKNVAEAAPTDVIDLEKADIPVETKVAGTEIGLDIMRNVFEGMNDYVIISSTALYLHSKKAEKRGAEKDTFKSRPPGDLDVVMFSNREFQDAMSRLQNMTRHESVEAVNLERPTQLKGEDTKRMQGEIIMKMDGKKYKYPIEIFLNTSGTHRLIDESTMKMADHEVNSSKPLRILDLEGLQRQYKANFEMERRVDNQIEIIRKAVTDNVDITTEIRAAFEQWSETKEWPEDSYIGDLLEGLDEGPDQLASIFLLSRKLEVAQENGDKKAIALARTQMAEQIGAFKTKLAARQDKIERIRSGS